MADISMTITTHNGVSPLLRSIQKKLDALPKEVHNEFIKNTPVKSGNARRKTTLKGNEIHANYPYAKRLDEGYSQQSPDGMIKPTEEFIKKRINQILKGR